MLEHIPDRIDYDLFVIYQQDLFISLRDRSRSSRLHRNTSIGFWQLNLSIAKNPPFEKGGEGGISAAGLDQKSPPAPLS